MFKPWTATLGHHWPTQNPRTANCKQTKSDKSKKYFYSVVSPFFKDNNCNDQLDDSFVGSFEGFTETLASTDLRRKCRRRACKKRQNVAAMLSRGPTDLDVAPSQQPINRRTSWQREIACDPLFLFTYAWIIRGWSSSVRAIGYVREQMAVDRPESAIRTYRQSRPANLQSDIHVRELAAWKGRGSRKFVKGLGSWNFADSSKLHFRD